MGLKVYWMLTSSLLGLIGSNRFLLYRQQYAVLLIFGLDTQLAASYFPNRPGTEHLGPLAVKALKS